ncbi:hypothetical protein ACRALDRAFT_1066273 [Sodiomyces alcalophilus JCM 7366]|uniref:uncharacterized protein n=1 Tax=Sodiomyces alcalophilus JCM 7366 TaxID=591952 RepID=UPI0039B4B99E
MRASAKRVWRHYGMSASMYEVVDKSANGIAPNTRTVKQRPRREWGTRCRVQKFLRAPTQRKLSEQARG